VQKDRAENTMGDWIVAEPGILGGKPRVQGTRISVEFLLELLASGATREEILHAYPQIQTDGLTAALQYVARIMKSEVVWDVPLPA
jgi:uncharacterized protein (DUF433 family)